MNAEKSRKQLNHPSIMAATYCFMEFRFIQNMRCAIRNVDSECLEVSIGIFVLHERTITHRVPLQLLLPVVQYYAKQMPWRFGSVIMVR